MLRRSLCVVVAVLATLAMGSCAALAASGPTKPATVAMRNTKLGPVLTTGFGYTLFAFTKDTPNMDNCVTTFGCRTFWPPLLTAGAPVAGAGVNASMLGTITLANGQTQVTYNGDPLYGYLFDFLPQETGYVGAVAFGGTWEAVTPSGTLVM